MNYKEKYEQALERARQFSEKPYLEDSAGIVEYIFPELKESEDEEMKREIIEFLKSRAGFKQEWIDWLNKQSEKKESYIDMSLVDAVRFCVADNLAHKSTDDNGNTIGFSVYIDDTTAQKLTNELFAIFQKSVEWSEEDKRELDSIYQIIDFLPTSDSHLTKENKKAMLDWLIFLKKRVQLKQEWSEEDTNNLTDVCNILLGSAKTYGCAKKYINWLKSLRLQIHWKPSAEQIKGIECAIKTLRHQLNVGDKRLNSLYDDLKKLREE